MPQVIGAIIAAPGAIAAAVGEAVGQVVLSVTGSLAAAGYAAQAAMLLTELTIYAGLPDDPNPTLRGFNP